MCTQYRSINKTTNRSRRQTKRGIGGDGGEINNKRRKKIGRGRGKRKKEKRRNIVQKKTDYVPFGKYLLL